VRRDERVAAARGEQPSVSRPSRRSSD
jgi:hypothetical protein